MPENDTIVPRHADFDLNKGYTLAGYTNELNRVKTRIQQESNVDVVVLVAHITIPYSGDAKEDGNDEHKGAWPADTWYGDLHGVWTDNTNRNSCDQPLTNTRGEWKWDQDYFPVNSNGVKELEVVVGRIDFANMPAFIGASYLTNATDTTSTERALLKNYFQKDRWYRSKVIAPTDTWRQWIQDLNFLDMVPNARSIQTHLHGTLPEDSRATEDVFVTADAHDGKRYLWGLHAAHGQPDAIAIIDTSNDPDKFRYSRHLAYTNNEPQVIFYILGGSYVADWNEQGDEFMRACLSTSTNGLAAVWAGDGYAEPWRMDRLALEYHLGAMLQDTIAANDPQSSRAVYLLGDPILHTRIVAPPQSQTVVANWTGTNWEVGLTWTASPDAANGYFVCRGQTSKTP